MVDLPQPLGPTSATNSWGRTARSVGCNASSLPSRTGKRLLAPARRIFAAWSISGIAPPQQSPLHRGGGFRYREAEQHQNEQRRVQSGHIETVRGIAQQEAEAATRRQHFPGRRGDEGERQRDPDTADDPDHAGG